MSGRSGPAEEAWGQLGTAGGFPGGQTWLEASSTDLGEFRPLQVSVVIPKVALTGPPLGVVGKFSDERGV